MNAMDVLERGFLKMRRRVLRYRAVVRHPHLVDCANACLNHVGLEAQLA